MVEAKNESVRYQTHLTSGAHSAISDTTSNNGGSDSGFRPHDLLEAALASCMNISLRMYADQHGIPLSGIVTRVKLDRSTPEETVFEYNIQLSGNLAKRDRARLLEVAENCPIRQTLSKHIRFQAR